MNSFLTSSFQYGPFDRRFVGGWFLDHHFHSRLIAMWRLPISDPPEVVPADDSCVGRFIPAPNTKPFPKPWPPPPLEQVINAWSLRLYMFSQPRPMGHDIDKNKRSRSTLSARISTRLRCSPDRGVTRALAQLPEEVRAGFWGLPTKQVATETCTMVVPLFSNSQRRL